MHDLLIRKWEGEGVVYNIQSGDMHLLSSFNIDLITSFSKNKERHMLLSEIRKAFQVDINEAEKYLDNLCLEYQKFNLIN